LRLEIGGAQQMRDVVLAAGEIIVDTQHVVALRQQALAQMRTQEAGAAGHEYPFPGEAHKARPSLPARVTENQCFVGHTIAGRRLVGIPSSSAWRFQYRPLLCAKVHRMPSGNGRKLGFLTAACRLTADDMLLWSGITFAALSLALLAFHV